MNNGYLLDTNIVSRLVRKRPPIELVEKIAQNQGMLFVSSITIEELLFGALKAPSVDSASLQGFVERVVQGFTVLPYDIAAARWAAQLRWELFQQRHTIEHPDVCIAAQAASRGLTLVTHNLKDFARFSCLTLEDWVKA